MATNPFPLVELDALYELYTNTNGECWTWKSNQTLYGKPWNFTDFNNRNPCTESWQGLYCYSDCSNNQLCTIEFILLSSYNLKGFLPSSIGNFSQLAYIDLSSNFLTSTVPETIGNWSPCEGIILSYNMLRGTVPPTISRLEQLTVLDMRNNQFSGIILPYLVHLSPLYYLHIENNMFIGTIPNAISNLTTLREFYIRNNGFVGTMPNSLTKLTTMQYCDMSYNQLQGTIPQDIGNLYALTYFLLTNNALVGSIPASIVQLTYLQQLVISDNALTGTLPEEIGNLQYLFFLNLHDNQLNGTLPNSMGNMVSMLWLRLYNNYFTGTLPLSIQNLRNLEELYLRANNFHGNLFDRIAPLSQLQVIEVCYNNFTGTIPLNMGSLWSSSLYLLFLCNNSFNGTIPESINGYMKLLYVNLCVNKFTGSLPKDVLSNAVSLESFSVCKNNLNGTIPTTVGNWQYLDTFDVSSNHFSGTIPPEITNFTKISQLYLGQNHFHGSLPVFSAGKYMQLVSFIAEYNQLTGPLPVGLFAQPTLQILHLNNNYLTGTIPSIIGNMTNLVICGLFNNSIHGTIPPEIGNILTLQQFTVYINLLSGTIPPSMGNIPKLQLFMVYDNILTGTIPDTLGNWKNLSSFTIFGNEISGNLPVNMGNFTNIHIFDVYSNQLTGTLPESFQYFKQCQVFGVPDNYLAGSISMLATMKSLFNFNLSRNLFSGNIHATFQTLTSMTEIDISINSFSGSIENSFANMPYLSLLILRDNAFTGSLDQLTNTTVQQALTVIDVSDNQFTGSLPADPFHSPLLVSFAAVKNCITGSIPEIICANEQLRTVALDGLHTAESCQDRFFPTIREIESYALNTNLPGGLPGCLFNMSSLETLHLSGNGIAGKIPEDISIGKNLKDLSLSYNQLSGRIPSLIQEHAWTNLDLSFNKLDGVLSSTFAVPGNTSSLTLTVNRLSGSIPSSLLDAEQIDILKGNVFSCEKDGGSSGFSWSLPKHDNHASSYDCGSDAVNTSLYIWLGLIFVIVVGVILLWKLSRRRRKQQSGNEEVGSEALPNDVRMKAVTDLQTVESSWGVLAIDRGLVRLKQWYAVTNEASEALVESDHVEDHKSNKKRLYILGRSMRVLRKLSVLIALFAVLMLMPMYCILTVYYGSHTYSYAWTVSLAYLSGLTAAMILMVVLVIFYVWLVWVVGILKEQVNEKSVNTSQKRDFVQPSQIIVESQSASSVTSSTFSLLSIQVPTLDSLIFCKRQPKIEFQNIYLKVVVAFANCFVVMIVNICYVYITTLNLSNQTMFGVVLSLSSFKIIWNNIVVLQWIRQYLLLHWSQRISIGTLQVDVNPYAETVERVYFLIHILLFNNIIAPVLANAFVDPSCFYYLIQSPNKVTASYNLQHCINFIVLPGTTFCSAYGEGKYSTSYSPPYLYSFQCSSSLLSDFIAVFIYRYIMSGILAPIFHVLYNTYVEESGLEDRTINSDDKNSRNEEHSLQSRSVFWTMCRNRLKAILTYSQHDEEQFVINHISDLAIMLTFGIVFPPLSLVICSSIILHTLREQLMLGKLIVTDQQHDIGDKEKNQVCTTENIPQIPTNTKQQKKYKHFHGDTMKLFWPALPTLTIMSAGFIGFFLFDILGDQAGVMQSFWMILFMTFIPVILWIGNVYYGRHRKASKSTVVSKDVANYELQMNPLTMSKVADRCASNDERKITL